MKRALLSLILLLFLSACAGAPEYVPEPVPPGANAARIKIFYATDRNLTGEVKAAEKFGVERGDSLTFGAVEMVVPWDRKFGQPYSSPLWKLEKNDKVGSDPLLDSTSLTPEGDFLRDFSARLSRFKGKSALVFIHGYNVDFEAAAVSAAKLAYQLSFDGPVVFYSWPSKGSTSEYMADGAAIEWSTVNMRRFLETLLDRTEAQNVFLVAHSMGNRGLTRSLVTLFAARPELGRRVSEVVLAAPDVDKGVFKSDLAPAIAKAGIPITLYAASDDRALSFSRKLHAYPRAGDTSEGALVARGVETIDCSGAGGGFFNHSYITEDARVTSDIAQLLKKRQRAGERSGLVEVKTPEGRYWKLAK